MAGRVIGDVTPQMGGKSKGPPPAVKKLLSLFGSGREEDRMVGYLSFLKLGPKLLRFLPGMGLGFRPHRASVRDKQFSDSKRISMRRQCSAACFALTSEGI